MKVINKILPITLIGAIASIITPFTASCTKDNGDWKDITTPDTTGWRKTRLTGNVTSSRALTDYFEAIELYGKDIVENDVKWSGWETHEILPTIVNLLSDTLIVKQMEISKWQGYFKDFSFDRLTRTLSYKTGLNFSLSAELDLLLSDVLEVKITTNLSVKIENELYKMPMTVRSCWKSEDLSKPFPPTQHQLISVDYKTLQAAPEALLDSYAKTNVSIVGTTKQEGTMVSHINFHSGDITFDKSSFDPDAEWTFVDLLAMYASIMSTDGWFSYYLDGITIPEEDNN